MSDNADRIYNAKVLIKLHLRYNKMRICAFLYHYILIKSMHKLIVFLLAALLSGAVWAQNKDVMQAYQQELDRLFEKVFTAATDNERYNANEMAVQSLSEALEQDNSFYYKWNFGNRVSVLTSSDKQFRIFSWPVVRDNGEYECFGFVQSWNEKTNNFDVYVLNDKSDENPSPEESVLFPESWYGCVYQELIETKHEGRTYYTLIGWTGIDNLSQRKIMEPISFRPTSSKPQFGLGVFKKEKNRRRVVLEYSRNAMVNMRYDEQYCQVVENKKTKKNGRTINVQESHNEKFKMILFDEIAPMITGMEGLTQYYVPTGTEMAYIFVAGKWEKHEGAQGRLSNEKLNKEFAPLPKNKPSYSIELGE